VYDTGWQNVIRPNKTLQMCRVKIESGLGYKSSQVRVQVRVQQKWTEVRTRVQVWTRVLQVCLLLAREELRLSLSKRCRKGWKSERRSNGNRGRRERRDRRTASRPRAKNPEDATVWLRQTETDWKRAWRWCTLYVKRRAPAAAAEQTDSRAMLMR